MPYNKFYKIQFLELKDLHLHKGFFGLNFALQIPWHVITNKDFCTIPVSALRKKNLSDRSWKPAFGR